MRPPRLFSAVVCVLAAAWLTPALSAQQVAGRGMNAQQVLDMLNRLVQHSSKLEPMLGQVRASEWVAKGAPDAYVSQLATCQRMIPEIGQETASLAQHPERLPDSMKVLFKVLNFHRTLDSLMGGLRRYQNPALAELILSVAAEDSADLEVFQQYLLETAGAREEEFGVADREAQRCRGMLLRQPAAAPAPRATPKKQ